MVDGAVDTQNTGLWRRNFSARLRICPAVMGSFRQDVAGTGARSSLNVVMVVTRGQHQHVACTGIALTV